MSIQRKCPHCSVNMQVQLGLGQLYCTACRSNFEPSPFGSTILSVLMLTINATMLAYGYTSASLTFLLLFLLRSMFLDFFDLAFLPLIPVGDQD